MPTKDPIKKAANQRRRYWRNRAKALARKARYREKHKEEIRVRNEKYRAENRDEINRRHRAKPKKGRAAHQLRFPLELLFPEFFREYRRDMQYRTLYKITAAEFDAKKAEQGNRCATCRRSFDEVRAVADHNRRTGKFRAVLCDSCNLAIGHAYEKPGTLRALASYIQTA